MFNRSTTHMSTNIDHSHYEMRLSNLSKNKLNDTCQESYHYYYTIQVICVNSSLPVILKPFHECNQSNQTVTLNKPMCLKS
ncbi:hypothetical protein KSF78_0000195 [Schistosoma japonicum]|nr:hypothetical protein KSF78_0000195 [Schistosoma japonicum]